MGIFGNKKTRKLIGELRRRSQHSSDEFSKEINEMLEELKAEYEESSEVLPEFERFVAELNTRISAEDRKKLQEFSMKLSLVDRSARKGVDAMWELSRNQRKLTAENLRNFEEVES